jgi:MFS family permease
MTSPALQPRRKDKLLLLLTLYVSQAIPLGFFLTAMPVILRRSGLSLEHVGLFSAIAFPWLLKFLWAPLLDRWSPGRRRYLSWVTPLQGAAVIMVSVLAFLDLGSQLPLVVGVSALFMLLAATQDIASDGLAVTILRQGERGLGNGLQVGGYYLGQILGGGLILVIFSRFGWTVAVLAMAAFLTLPLLPASRYPEPATGDHRTQGLGMANLARFFRRSGSLRWSAVVVLFRTGETMATYVFNQMMVDLGVGLATIGWISGMIYAAGALGGALLGGALAQRLERRRALTTFATLQAAATGGYILAVGGQIWLLGIAAFVMAFTGGMATTALYTSMMDASSQRSAATDFTLQQSLSAFGPLAGTALSGFSAAHLGFTGHYVLCALVTLATVALLLGTTLPRQPEASLAEPVGAGA